MDPNNQEARRREYLRKKKAESRKRFRAALEVPPPPEGLKESFLDLGGGEGGLEASRVAVYPPNLWEIGSHKRTFSSFSFYCDIF